MTVHERMEALLAIGRRIIELEKQAEDIIAGKDAGHVLRYSTVDAIGTVAGNPSLPERVKRTPKPVKRPYMKRKRDVASLVEKDLATPLGAVQGEPETVRSSCCKGIILQGKDGFWECFKCGETVDSDGTNPSRNPRAVVHACCGSKGARHLKSCNRDI